MPLDEENARKGSPVEKLTEKLKLADKLKIGDVELLLDTGDLDEYHIEKAERELRETPEIVQESLKILIDMLADEEELFVPLEQEFLQKFLRRCKWYPKSAFKLIKRYYEYKHKYAEYYGNLLPSQTQIFTTGLVTPLPVRAADGVRTVLVIPAGPRWNPKEVSLGEIFRGVLMILEVSMAEPKTQVSGIRVLVDMEGLTLSQVTYFTPTFAAAIIEFVQRCLPSRLKGVHIVNQSFVFDMVYAVFKPFLYGKVRDRIYFHGRDRSSILQHIDAKALPRQYGGDFNFPEEPIGELFREYSLVCEEYFAEMGRYGYVSEL